jgi:hypothetical protein
MATKKTAARSSALKQNAKIELLEGKISLQEFIEEHDEIVQALSRKFTNLHNITGKYPELIDSDIIYLWVLLDKFFPGPNLKKQEERYFGKSPSVQREVKHLFTSELATVILAGDLSIDTAFMGDDEAEEYASDLFKDLEEIMLTDMRGSYSAPTQALFVPIPNRKDEDLLKSFATEPRDEDIIAELRKRSKGLPFLAYTGPGEEGFQMDLSLDLLKEARRKREVPRRIKDCDVYTIDETDIKNRIRYECPTCEGSVLIHDTCPSCERNFHGVTLADRRRIRQASLYNAKQKPTKVTTLRRNALLESGSIDDLRGIIKEAEVSSDFAHQDLLGNVPSLVLIDAPVVPLSPSELKEVDAFHRRK